MEVGPLEDQDGTSVGCRYYIFCCFWYVAGALEALPCALWEILPLIACATPRRVSAGIGKDGMLERWGEEVGRERGRKTCDLESGRGDVDLELATFTALSLQEMQC